MKNKIKDLNSYLFDQLDTITNADLSEEELKKEITRTKAISDIATQIIRQNEVMLDIVKLQLEHGASINTAEKVLIGMIDEK